MKSDGLIAPGTRKGACCYNFRACRGFSDDVGLYYSAGLVCSMRRWVFDENPAACDSLVETGIALLRAMLQS